MEDLSKKFQCEDMDSMYFCEDMDSMYFYRSKLVNTK